MPELKFIIRMKCQENIYEFHFDTKKEMESGEAEMRKTGFTGFSALTEDGHNGHVFAKFGHHDRFESKSLRRDVKWGPYSDSVWRVYGNKNEMEKKCRETNDQATCWASVTAKVIHIAGDMYACEFRDPFKD